jgi:hypothetical protein
MLRVTAVIVLHLTTTTLVAAVAPTATTSPCLLGVGDRHRRGAAVVPEVGLMPSAMILAFITTTLVAAVTPTVTASRDGGNAGLIGQSVISLGCIDCRRNSRDHIPVTRLILHLRRIILQCGRH